MAMDEAAGGSPHRIVGAGAPAGPPVESAWRRVANFIVILFGPGATGMAFGVIAPVLKPMAAQFGSEQLSQIIVVMPLLGLAVGSLAGAWIAERLGARRTTGLSGLILALAGVAPMVAPMAPVLLAVCFLVGLAGSTMFIGTTLLLADRYSDDQRAKVLGYANAFGNIATTSTVMLSGVIADRVGWRGSFLQFTVAGVIIVLFTLVAIRPVAAGPRQRVAQAPLSLIIPMLPLFAANFLMFVAALAMYTHIPLLLAAEGVTSITVTSTVIATQTLFGIAAGLTYGMLQARFGKFAVAMLGLGLLAAGGLLTAASHAPIGFGVACGMIGFGIGLISPYLIDLLLGRAPASVRARSLGVFTTVGFLGGFANPFVMRPIRGAVGLHGVFVVIAAAAVAMIGVALLARGRAGGLQPTPGRPLH